MSALFPWPTYQNPWQLDITAVSFDGVISENAIDDLRATVHCPNMWDSATISVTATTTQKAIATHYDGYLLVTAAATLFRQAFRLTADGSGGFVGDIIIHKDQLNGIALLSADITADFSGRIRTIGQSEPWRFTVDGGARPFAPGMPPIEMQWVDFSDPKAPFAARTNPMVPAVVEMGSIPMVYLNKGLPGLEQLLYANTAKMERRLFRELVSAEIARLVTSALLQDALTDSADASLSDYDDIWEPPTSLAASNTLAAIAEAMALEPQQLAQKWVMADTPNLRSELFSAIEAAIMTVSGLSESIAESTAFQNG